MNLDILYAEPSNLQSLDVALGYLNFSSGAEDLQLLRELNSLFYSIQSFLANSEDRVSECSSRSSSQDEASLDAPEVLYRLLQKRLEALNAEGGAFSNVDQAKSLLGLWWNELIPRYRTFHKDLLFHQTRQTLWGPFSVARGWQALLEAGPDWSDTERLCTLAITKLNDYVGYRPVAVLENHDCEPYANEWVCPLPLYIQSVGVAAGPYAPLLKTALDILNHADPSLLRESWFDPEMMEELALDPRSYDFDHPVNHRPAYHFGQWDPHRIDNRGMYRRFVLQQVAIDALLERVRQESVNADAARQEELLFEAGAVLAGTILMASGLCGNGPGCHDSSVSLGTLLPKIAGYRNRFYEQLVESVSGAHGKRLRIEAEQLHQPLGSARQHLNQELSRRRSQQLQKAHWAVLCARMGYSEAAKRNSNNVRVASVRIMSKIHCLLTSSHDFLDRGELAKVPEQLDQIEDLLHRGIACGALIDPWNIVGFGGNFSIFPAMENSILDTRVERFITLVEQVMNLAARGWSEAAAEDNEQLDKRFAATLSRLATWWDTYATSSVKSVHRLVGKEVEVSSNLVAGALNAWHKAGAAAGDIGFWRMFVGQFDTPKAFQLVLEALLDHDETIASMALMMQWASQAERTPLEEGDASFRLLANQWMTLVHSHHSSGKISAEKCWQQIRRFFELLEANAEDYWNAPRFYLGESPGTSKRNAPSSTSDHPDMADTFTPLRRDDTAEENVYSAAYENVIYQDSTDDGIDDSLLGGGEDDGTDFELEEETRHLSGRLSFLTTVAMLWKRTVIESHEKQTVIPEEQVDYFQQWQKQAKKNLKQLKELLHEVSNYPLQAPSQTAQSLLDYDRRRMMKDQLLDSITNTYMETGDAEWLLTAACVVADDNSEEGVAHGGESKAKEAPDSPVVPLLHGLLTSSTTKVQHVWKQSVEWLCSGGLLYIPISKGGDPETAIDVRSRQRLSRQLLDWLPRLGLLKETCELLANVHAAEISSPMGKGTVTEFDKLFTQGHEAMIRCLVASSKEWTPEPTDSEGHGDDTASMLVEALEYLNEFQMLIWIDHSRSLRLGVVEKITQPAVWNEFVAFVETYGSDLFTQMFLGYSNLRAILHQGVETWLTAVEENTREEDQPLVVRHLREKVSLADAVKWITFTLETVVENYNEYRDYNSTTTQSDQGELIYIFVEFMKLLNEYNRVAWNISPLIITHDILSRQGQTAAAERWRQMLSAKTSDVAEAFLQQHDALCKKYGVMLPTVAGRIQERFTRPLDVGKIRALVPLAVKHIGETKHSVQNQERGQRQPAPSEFPSGIMPDSHTPSAFQQLEKEIEILSDKQTNAGMNIPDWLVILEEEVDLARSKRDHNKHQTGLPHAETQVCIGWNAFYDIMDELDGSD